MKKRVLMMALALLLVGQIGAQQLTRFAVVDLSRVYMSFFRDSRAVREFEEQSALVQAEIDRMTKEIQELTSVKYIAEAQGDRTLIARIENEIYQKSERLNEYYQLKTAELEDRRYKLTQSDTFMNEVYGEIRAIAESEGYSMVLNLKENTGILWYSPTVDITDRLIRSLLSKAGR
ncbi:MAG: OmpH family outer membrane protein [Treponema sp.]|jgi:outer membrane protein|nr:OmpH family outer membrane protein [Treponema sp.]